MKKIINPWRRSAEGRLQGKNHEGYLTIRAKVTKQVRNLAYISAEITNSKGELCNEGEAIYFLMNEEKAKEMGFLHCEVED